MDDSPLTRTGSRDGPGDIPILLAFRRRRNDNIPRRPQTPQASPGPARQLLGLHRTDHGDIDAALVVGRASCGKSINCCKHNERTWSSVGRDPADPANNTTARIIGLTRALAYRTREEGRAIVPTKRSRARDKYQ